MVANNAQTLNVCTKAEQLLWHIPTAAAKTSDAGFLYSFKFSYCSVVSMDKNSYFLKILAQRHPTF
jgi:hypothetical protein